MPWGDFLKKAASDLLGTQNDVGGQTWDESVEDGLLRGVDESTRSALGVGGHDPSASEDDRAYYRALVGTGEAVQVTGDVTVTWLSGGVMDWIETDDGMGFTLFEPSSGLAATLYASSDGQVLMDGDLAWGQLSGEGAPETLEYWPGRGFRMNGLVLESKGYGDQPDRHVILNGQLTTNESGTSDRP